MNSKFRFFDISELRVLKPFYPFSTRQDEFGFLSSLPAVLQQKKELLVLISMRCRNPKFLFTGFLFVSMCWNILIAVRKPGGMYFFVDIRTGSSDNDSRLTQQMCNINMLLLWHRYCVDAFPYGTSLGRVALGIHGGFSAGAGARSA